MLTRTADQMTIATFNLHELSPAAAQSRFNNLARQIVVNLDAPDILVLQEVEDNSGGTDDGTVDASQTYSRLIEAIQAAGGPLYQSLDIPPQDNADGGVEGGNIRVGFLFRADRGLVFVDRPGGDATTPVTLTMSTAGPELSFSPGRISPAHSAFYDGRKPLVGEFLFNGQKLFVIGLHLKSRIEDGPLFGRYQPPLRTTEITRTLQARIINDFVQDLLALDPGARVIVAGDLNDTDFSASLSILAGAELYNLTGLLPVNERYTYVYEGNSQALDHILVSQALIASTSYDLVHVNAEFYSSRRASDHDPALARVTLATVPPRYTIYLPWIQRGKDDPQESRLGLVGLLREPGDEGAGCLYILPILWAFCLQRFFQQRYP
jgi:predicted extracellular nuclease